MKIASPLILASTLVLATLVGCAAATDTTPANNTPAKSTTVYQITGTAASNVKGQIDLKVATGKTLSGAHVVYAIDATYAGGNHGWWTDGAWKENFATTASAASTWTTVTAGAAVTGTDNVELEFWVSTGKVSLKQLKLSYSDTSSEIVTFTSAAGTPVHRVFTPATGAVVTTDEAFNWTWFDTGLAGSVTTVAF